MRLPALLVAIMLLAACGGESAPEPTREVLPTFTATILAPTVVPTNAPPTIVPPTSIPPTDIPPTTIPPTSVPPTVAALPVVEATPVPILAPTNTPQPVPISSEAVANDVANLRGGPGTEFGVVGSVAAGQALVIEGRNAGGDWYQLSDGTWIAAFLVTGAPGDVAIVEAMTVEPPAAEVVNTPTESAAVVAPPVEQPTAAPVVVNETTDSSFTCAGGCATAPDPSCAIKGNFNGSGGDKIFHQPGGRWYDNTDIVAADGDVWFCSVDEAIAAGYREAGK